MANTWTCASASYADVNYYAGDGAGSSSVLDGDTVVIPAGNSTWTNGQGVVVTKAITIRGSNVVLGTVQGKTRIPTSCGTVITDGHTNDLQALFSFVREL